MELPLYTYRFISPSVIDKINNLKLITDECSIKTNISRQSTAVLGGGFGQVLEDIDDLSKSITLKGEVLLHDVYEKQNDITGKYVNIGYVSQTQNDGYKVCDLYNWITDYDNKVYYQYIKSLSLNIGTTSSISIDMETHSPMLTQDSDLYYFLKPEIEIRNTGEVSSITSDAGQYLKTGRVLKNFDIQIIGTSDYVSNIDYVINFNWNKIKSIPTYTDKALMVQYNGTSSYYADQHVTTPPMPLSVLSDISVKMSYTIYINGRYTGNDLENWIGNAISPLGFIKIKLKDNSPLTAAPLEMLTSILRKWVDPDLMNFRRTESSISTPAEDITKVNLTYESTYKTNIIYGQVDPLI